MEYIDLSSMNYEELKELRKMVREEMHKKMNIENLVEAHNIQIDGLEVLIDDFPLRNIADGGVKFVYDEKLKLLELTINFTDISSFNVIRYKR